MDNQLNDNGSSTGAAANDTGYSKVPTPGSKSENGSASAGAFAGDDRGLIEREFSLKSFKCFAREHPFVAWFGAAGLGAAVATLGAGYLVYRGAKRGLPRKVLRFVKAVA